MTKSSSKSKLSVSSCGRGRNCGCGRGNCSKAKSSMESGTELCSCAHNVSTKLKAKTTKPKKKA